ncbi:MAG TPA: response regulator transcription factor [Candidatus Baltobacteraceae bacterium]|nr:response regulator transcription factor [Candidatus Baltobacteraceae bacterium]
MQSASLREVTIGRLLEEAKAARKPQAIPPKTDSAAFPFHKYLTEREAQVANLIAQGDSNKEIGDRLSLSAKTVKNHVSNILRKLALQRRTQVAIMALRRELPKAER